MWKSLVNTSVIAYVHSMNEKRAYRLKERAKSQEQTRQKIVKATMHLHEEVGPRATTISAIAERAGVQRLTVYRHFPDETAVFQACTAHWLTLNPPPDPAAWAGIADPAARLDAALGAFYRYYSATERMWTTSHRDVAEVPALQGPMAQFSGFLASVGEALAGAFDAPPETAWQVHTTIQLALVFPTWAQLQARGLSDAQKVSLVGVWTRGAMSGSATLPAR